MGLLLALWPILVVHAAYAISVVEQHVPLCNPYWDGCTSISRAGRHGWANHLFRATLLPYTILLGIYWWLNQRWLLAIGDAGSRAMLVAGWTGALFMILYVTFLGTEGPTYQLMRRYGINVYFGATYVAQVLLVLRLRAFQGQGRKDARLPGWLVPGLMLLAAGVLGIGLGYAAARLGFGQDQDRLENALEWVAALLMQASVLLVALGWRAAGLAVRIDCPVSAARRDPAEP